MAPLLKGTAFLTGAGSGIGRATSLAFADHGITNLSLTDLDAASITATTKLIKEAHPSIHILDVPLDVTDEEQVKSAIAKTVAEFGPIDIAVNLAGIAHAGGTHECETAAWKNLMSVNLDGLFFCHREEIRQMLKQE
jgi:NAD(P)-dependent dehydrogenase (short-subunit alcohol dehydrogenase family)